MSDGVELVEFVRPARLLSMNDRAHWRVQRRDARTWRYAACYAANQQLGYLPKVRRGPSMVEVVLPVIDRRRRDPHNFFPTVKHVIDGLVDAGVWPDDTPEWVTTKEPVLAVTPTGPRHLVIVRITPRTPNPNE